MPIRMIWRLRRKFQIRKRYFTKESKQKMGVVEYAETSCRNIQIAKK